MSQETVLVHPILVRRLPDGRGCYRYFVITTVEDRPRLVEVTDQVSHHFYRRGVRSFAGVRGDPDILIPQMSTTLQRWEKA